MSRSSILHLLGRWFPSLASAPKPEHEHERERQQNRAAIERAHRVVDAWNERHRENWRTDGQHHAV